jgi:hypothetical protein
VKIFPGKFRILIEIILNRNLIYIHLNQFESIIKDHAHTLRIDYETLLQLLQIKLDRNEIEHDSIKNFLRYHSNGNSSFNAYLNSIGTTDVFTINEKLCLEILYRNYFLDYYSIQ